MSTNSASWPVTVRMGDGFPEHFLLASASENISEKGAVRIRQWQRGEANAPILGEPTIVDASRVLDLRALLAAYAPLPL